MPETAKIPVLSVVVPVFNGERFLATALASVRRWSGPSEIILVDDGSTDRTPELARGWKGLIYIRKENAGPAAARNRGLEAAHGEFIAFLDSDDLWVAGHPESGVEYLIRHPGVDAVLGQTQCILDSTVTEEGLVVSGEPFHSYQLGAAIVRRALLEKIGGFNPAMRHGEDVDWFLRIRESGAAVATLPKVSLYYRLHAGNQPTIYRASREGLLNAFHRSLERRRGLTTASPGPLEVKRPLISVIIPVFNGERFIADAIRSVVAQDYRPLELIVVDDGSTDRTREIVREMPEATLLEQPHGGAGSARNIGVRSSKGEFVAFLDADDVWNNEKLTRQMEAFVADVNLEAVFGHTVPFSEESRENILQPLPSPTPATMLIRRAAFDRIGWFNDDPTALEGVDWFLRAKEQSLRTRMLPDVLYRRRIHGGNRSIVNRDLNGYVRAIKASLDRRRSHSAPD